MPNEPKNWAEEELKLLNEPNLLMPKMYSFTQVKELLAQALREKEVEARKKFNEIAEVLQSGDLEGGLTLADKYAGNLTPPDKEPK